MKERAKTELPSRTRSHPHLAAAPETVVATAIATKKTAVAVLAAVTATTCIKEVIFFS